MDFLDLLQRTKVKEGRKALFALQEKANGLCKTIFEDLCDYCFAQENWSTLSFADVRRFLWILRNCCCGDAEVVPIVQSKHVIAFLYQFLKSEFDRYLISKMISEEDRNTDELPRFSEEELSTIFSIMLQLYCNFCSISEASTNIFHEHVDYQNLLDLMAISQQLHNRAATGMIWHLVYLSILSTRSGYEARMEMLISNRSLLCALYLSLQERSPTAAKEEDLNEQEKQREEIEKRIYEWSYLFSIQLIQQKKLEAVYEILSSKHSELFCKSSDQTVNLVNMEQV